MRALLQSYTWATRAAIASQFIQTIDLLGFTITSTRLPGGAVRPALFRTCTVAVHCRDTNYDTRTQQPTARSIPSTSSIQL